MFKVNRTGALAIVLVCFLVFLPPFNGFVSRGLQSVEDILDSRPERSVLFIGNSRTFYHDMPFMVRRIADSAGYPEKLHVEMDAQPGVSLADHMKSGKTQDLLARRWDHVVLQVLSSEQYSAAQSGGAWEAAAAMIREVQANGSSPAMFVTWRYTDQCTNDAGMPPMAVGLSPSGYANMHINIQQQHARLAAMTGVNLVNVGLVWEDLQGRPRDFKLYDDCNHPSIYGSYLSALMFYSYFSGRDAADVTFRPDQISPDDAKMLRTIVSRYFSGRKDDVTASINTSAIR
jgi:hypothetical protein